MKSNVNAWEDFLIVVTKGHIVAAVLDHLGMTSVNDLPNPSIINANVWMENDSYRREKLLEIASYVIEKHVDLATE